MTIQEQLNAINAKLASVLAGQERSVEDRKETNSQIASLRDDISELMQLGTKVSDLHEWVGDHEDKITNIEAWRQRKIGAAGLLHATGAAVGAIVGATVSILFQRH